MDTIEVNNIRFYAYHGCLSQERSLGSHYLTDLRIKADLKTSASSDLLVDTVDYVLLHKIVEEEMGISSNLLEHVAKRILDRIMQISGVKKAQVSISKINPPVGRNVENVKVIMKSKK